MKLFLRKKTYSLLGKSFAVLLIGFTMSLQQSGAMEENFQTYSDRMDHMQNSMRQILSSLNQLTQRIERLEAKLNAVPTNFNAKLHNLPTHEDRRGVLEGSTTDSKDYPTSLVSGWYPVRFNSYWQPIAGKHFHIAIGINDIHQDLRKHITGPVESFTNYKSYLSDVFTFHRSDKIMLVLFINGGLQKNENQFSLGIEKLL